MTYYSHSKLDSFIQCPKKFFFRYVKKLEGTEFGVEAYMGTQVHTVLETFIKDCLDDKRKETKEYMKMFLDLYWKGITPSVFIVMSENNYQFYAERGLNCLYDYFKNNPGPTPDQKDNIKLEYNIKIPICNGKHTLTGYIDYLEFTDLPGGGKQATILDYKSGKKAPSKREVAEYVQLSIYDKAIRHLFKDVKETVLKLYFLVEQKVFTTHRTDEDREQTERYINETVETIESKHAQYLKEKDDAAKSALYPPEKSFLCGWCEYQAACPLFKHLYEETNLPTL